MSKDKAIADDDEEDEKEEADVNEAEAAAEEEEEGTCAKHDKAFTVSIDLSVRSLLPHQRFQSRSSPSLPPPPHGLPRLRLPPPRPTTAPHPPLSPDLMGRNENVDGEKKASEPTRIEF